MTDPKQPPSSSARGEVPPEPQPAEDVSRRRSRSSVSSMGNISAARKRSVQDFLSNALECPVCFEPIRPPISQCENGHVFCGSCRSRLTECSVCRVPFKFEIRCLQLEKMAESFEYPCLYARHGCSFTATLAAMAPHETNCPSRPRMRCPLPNGCQWEGPAFMFVAHLVEKHHRHSAVKPLEVNATGAASFRFALEKACTAQSYWVALYGVFDHIFFLLVRASAAELYTCVYVIREADAADAPEFTYTLRSVVADREFGTQAFAYEGISGPISSDSASFDPKASGRGLFIKQALLSRCFDRP